MVSNEAYPSAGKNTGVVLDPNWSWKGYIFLIFKWASNLLKWQWYQKDKNQIAFDRTICNAVLPTFEVFILVLFVLEHSVNQAFMILIWSYVRHTVRQTWKNQFTLAQSLWVVIFHWFESIMWLTSDMSFLRVFAEYLGIICKKSLK